MPHVPGHVDVKNPDVNITNMPSPDFLKMLEAQKMFSELTGKGFSVDSQGKPLPNQTQPRVPNYLEDYSGGMSSTTKTFMDKLADLFAETLGSGPVTQTDDMDMSVFNRMQDDYQQALRTLSSLINTNMFSEAGQTVMQGLQTQGESMQALGNMGMSEMLPQPQAPQVPQAPTMSPQSLANFGQRSTPPQQPQSYIPGM